MSKSHLRLDFIRVPESAAAKQKIPPYCTLKFHDHLYAIFSRSLVLAKYSATNKGKLFLRLTWLTSCVVIGVAGLCAGSTDHNIIINRSSSSRFQLSNSAACCRLRLQTEATAEVLLVIVGGGVFGCAVTISWYLLSAYPRKEYYKPDIPCNNITQQSPDQKQPTE